MQNFNELQLHPNISKALIKMNYSKPTPIQAQTLPLALTNRDVIGCAQTGTGKTAAFLIPMITKILKNNRKTGLILAPTRELTIQIADVLKNIAAFCPEVTSAVVIGGVPMGPQIKKLGRTPSIIIATPGRLVDHLRRGTVSLRSAEIFVLDEADRMLDMGFAPQLNEIMRFVPSSRQTLLFSATMPQEIETLAKKYMKSPVRVNAGEVSKPVTAVSQKALHIPQTAKRGKLTEELKGREGAVIIFMRTKHRTDSLCKFLLETGHAAGRLHGGRTQSQRQRALDGFRSGQFKILVATDIAARGIDISSINHVINFDLPKTVEDYVHRVGRTARAGAQGNAISFISTEEQGTWKQISKYLSQRSI